MSGCTQPPSRPNVILILTDDQGYGDIGFNGNPWIKTPHIDRLLEQATRFTDFHVDPTCSPSRAALMTGRYATRTGVWMTYMGRHHLRADEMTMADVFQQNGYHTGIIGKWHLGDNYPFRPMDRGFDASLIHGSGVIGEAPDYWQNDYYDDTYFRQGQPERFAGYCTDIWFEEAQSFIRQHKADPFFLYLPLNAPHGPMNVPRASAQPYLDHPDIPTERAWFYGMIAHLDARLGAFRAFLEEEGLARETLLIFMSDNGTASGFNPRTEDGFNAGMRGKKGSAFEGGHRVPLAMYWPAAGWDSSREIPDLTAHIDLLPTLADILDFELPEEIAFDGRSLVPLLQAEGPQAWPDRSLMVHNQISFGQKLEDDLPVKYKKYAVMDRRWRLVNGELFDLQEDPGQKRPVTDKHPAQAERMRAAYASWWEDVTRESSSYNRTIIGSARQQEVLLSAQFWHGDDVPYNQEHIRHGMIANGFWDIEVAEAGMYTFTLQRWPNESGLEMGAHFPRPERDSLRMYDGFKLYNLESNALDIVSAKIKIDSITQEGEVTPDMQGISFNIPLQKGPAFVQSWFTLDSGKTLGAYYVYVKKKED